jgi:hypothetical protein
LLRLHSLKSLQLDIKKLGVGLGVEGFDAPQPGNQQIEVHGDHNKVAGRDLIEKLDQLHADFAEIQQSITQDHRAIQNFFKGEGTGHSGPRSYVVNTLYERGERIADAMASVIQHWTSEGWKLEFFSSDYHGMDGVFLIFSHPDAEQSGHVQYFHGLNRERIQRMG